MNNEFYIGWMPGASRTVSRHVKKITAALFIIVVAAGLLLGLFQKKFSSGNFEYGVLTEVKGIYFNTPVPSVRVSSGKDLFGNSSFITIPLLGFGKAGAGGVIAAVEKEQQVSLDQKEIKLKGTLLYNDGKLLMQIDSNDRPISHIANMPAETPLPVAQPLGRIHLRGEIVDPKCFFGVMKPGAGKPHKDCAIRCILGGITPVLRVVNGAGAANYYFIVGPQGEPMNKAVKDFVAGAVSIEAAAVQWGDWIILYTGNSKIRTISKRDLVVPGLQTVNCMVARQ